MLLIKLKTWFWPREIFISSFWVGFLKDSTGVTRWLPDGLVSRVDMVFSSSGFFYSVYILCWLGCNMLLKCSALLCLWRFTFTSNKVGNDSFPRLRTTWCIILIDSCLETRLRLFLGSSSGRSDFWLFPLILLTEFWLFLREKVLIEAECTFLVDKTKDPLGEAYPLFEVINCFSPDFVFVFKKS
jgi:hypothetical protein